MNGPAVAAPLKPRALAGGWFQLRPVQTKPSGSIVMCWAMSLQPFSRVWWRHIPSTERRPCHWPWFGRQVWWT
jgi:hypothetical protein